ncbi:hypothetical protein GCM10020218_105890 [Dactylosporangium vinaceum]
MTSDPAAVRGAGEARTWLADKLDSFADPKFRAIYVDYDAAFLWRPDDPRLPALAERTAAWLRRRPERPTTLDPAIAQLVSAAAGLNSPGWTRLTELTRQAATRQ